MPQRGILFFVKYPEPGKVKTRLARSVGDVEAANQYDALARDNFAILRKVSADVCVLFDPPQKADAIREWLPGAAHYSAQHGDGLGQRLSFAFETFFKRGYESLIVYGSDTLGCRPHHLEAAFKGLEDRDVVLGPARDGGYYLLGLRKPTPRLFEEIPWSTSQVLKETLARADSLSLTYTLMETLEDLDEART